MMAACLSPVNLSAPMSAFFLKPASGAAYLPFPREFAASASTVTRQPRGPPEATSVKAARKAAPAPVNVTAPTTSWRDRVSAGPAEMSPKTSKTPRASPSPSKSASKRKARRSIDCDPGMPRPESPTSAPVVGSGPMAEAVSEPMSAPGNSGNESSSRVYDITFLLCLAASPLNGVTEAERAHMEDLVWHHTWRRGPHQSLEGPSSRSSSRSSSPARSSRSNSPSSSPSSSPAPVQRLRNNRRASSKLRNATSDSD